ncbi:MAG TPA: DUF3137 domain-containing protein [Candidatus Mucispirillum faecigallinarum]|uniref:DUF3137 domain-containing protein n=1 Tax=Candidatus Mucispirillum faecigallinarum TaxID=2838699 RepID=A0A9D2GT38_9BACT|nr:DUF3137 domain-containing protein [Candidatus Mucispirillum faecigallinarum]
MNSNYADFNRQYDELYEKTKAEKRKINIIYTTIIVTGLVVMGYFLFIYDVRRDTAEIIRNIGGAILIILYIRQKRLTRRLDAKFKQSVIPEMIKTVNPNLTYNAGVGHSEDEFMKTEIYTGSIDDFYSSDLVEGNIDKTHLKISFIAASVKQKTGKSTMLVPVFEGTLVTLDFNKYFTGKTKIYTKDFIAKFEGLMNSFGDEYEKINLENADFNDKFIVYTTDVQQAFYILSPNLIEKIMEIQSFNGTSRNMDVLFIDNRLYITFEDVHFLDMNKADNYTEQIALFQSEIKYFINMVEILELNNRIWSKE